MIPGHADSFRENGYAVYPELLDGEMLGLLRDGCDDLVAREDARMDAAGTDTLGITHRGKRYFAKECQRERPELRKVLFGEAMAEVCRQTLGNTAYFFFDQYVVKGPEQGMPFGWHQDSGYVVGNGGPADHAPYLTCWCPLDDATLDNGTIRLVPGSHRAGLRPHARQGDGNDLVVDVEEDGVAIEAPAGSVVAFSSLLLHATGANRSDTARRVYLAQYTSEAMLNPGTRQLRRNAIPFLAGGRRVTTA